MKTFLLMLVFLSSLSSAFAEEVYFNEVSCSYKILNGPEESKKVIAPYAFGSTPSRSLSFAYACSAFFSETHERLNPNGRLEYKIYVNGQLIKRYY